MTLNKDKYNIYKNEIFLIISFNRIKNGFCQNNNRHS